MTLTDICEQIVDCPHSTVQDEGEGVPLVRTSNIGKGRLLLEHVHRVSEEVYLERTVRAVPRENDLILAREAPVGNVALIKAGQRVCLGQRTVLLRPDTRKVLPAYLVYYLLSPLMQHRIVGASNGTIVKHLNLPLLRHLEVHLPDRKTQQEISARLSSIDDKLDLNRAMIVKLEEYIGLLYTHWFEEYRFPDKCGLPYKNSGGQMTVCPVSGKRIPVGWHTRPLLELVDWVGSSQPPKSTFIHEPREGYVRFIQNRDYDGDDHITYIPCAKNTKTVDEWDILIDKYGDAGRARYGIAGAFNVALGKICVNDPVMVEYVRSFFLSDSTYTYLHNTSMASTRASLSRDNLSLLSITVPDDSTVSAFQTKARRIREYILFLKRENRKLTETKERLLAYLF